MKPALLCLLLLPLSAHAADFSTIAYEERYPGINCAVYANNVKARVPGAVIIAGATRDAWCEGNDRCHAIVCTSDYSECADSSLTSRGMTYPLSQYERIMWNMTRGVIIVGDRAVAVDAGEIKQFYVAGE